MKIQWLGHSAFRLTESTGTTVITDPFSSELGYAMPDCSAHVVTVSHPHAHHSYVKGVKGNPAVLTQVGTFEIKGVQISSIETYPDDGEEEEAVYTEDEEPLQDPDKRNLIFKFRMDGVDVCHLGDINCECTPELIEQLMPIDILLLPVGGGDNTIDEEQAREYIDWIMPEIVIPMHYKSSRSSADLDKLDGFLREFDNDAVNETHLDTLTFDRDDFTGSGTKIVIPKRFKK